MMFYTSIKHRYLETAKSSRYSYHVSKHSLSACSPTLTSILHSFTFYILSVASLSPSTSKSLQLFVSRTAAGPSSILPFLLPHRRLLHSLICNILRPHPPATSSPSAPPPFPSVSATSTPRSHPQPPPARSNKPASSKPIPSPRPTTSAVQPFHAMASHNDSEPHVRWTLVVGDTQTDPANDNHNTNDDDDDVTAASTLHRHGSPTPIRPRAPTPTPPPSYSPSSSPPSSAADPDSDSDLSPNSPTSPLRGRPPPTLGPHHALVSRATARRRAGPSSIDFGPALSLLRPAGTSNLPLPTPTDFSSPPAQDALIEPLPRLSLRTPTRTEVLSRASTWTSTSGIDLSTFSGHRDTFAVLALHGLPAPAPALPPPIFARLAPYLDADAHAAVRLTCRTWSAGLTAAAPPAFRCSPAQRLPAELLQLIYGALRPVDFNAARRTCRGWMVAGLEGGVLEVVLRRGGWWGGVVADREVRRERRRGSVGVEWEWVMGRRVASECAMGPGWTGCGFEERDEEEEGDVVRMRGGGVRMGRSGMKLTAVTDFAELAGEKGGEALHFTVSVCGKFLLVAHARVVYVYQLCESERRGSTPTFSHGGSLALYAQIACPKRVLAVSMDTSSRRFAVAALLDDRTGMVVDLARARLAPDEAGIPRPRKSIWGPALGGMDALPSPEIGGEHSAAGTPERGDANNVHVLAYPLYQHPQVNHVAYHVAPLPPSPAASPLPHPTDPISAASALSGQGMSSTPSAPRTVYPALCTPTSPPLSVAICPQRRCVAFGCATGIELHWVDALTGQDLRRWFPLTAPSDFLYFLPKRRGVDSTKKLRLISSAGGAGQRGSLRSRFERREGRGMGVRAECETVMRSNEGSQRATDHLKAIPLSDGETILYADPATALLSLGTATPSTLPTRLSRTFALHGPLPSHPPTVYAAASDLRWGVRVVAAYASSLWLFCVPPDWFAAAKDRRKHMDAAREAPPIAIPGVHIATVAGLRDVAVDASSGSLTVWAFGAKGTAYTFQLDGGACRALRRRAVEPAGNVIELVDGDGDVVMRDAPPVFRTTEFDGAGSVAGEVSGRPSGSVSVSGVGVGERVVRSVVEVEGGVETGEVDEGYWSGEEGAFAVRVPSVEGRWSGESGEWEVDYLWGGVGFEGGGEVGV